MNYNCSDFLDVRNLQEQVKKALCYQKLLPKIVLTFHCLNKLFKWSQTICKFSAFSLEFQNFFSITRIFFSLIRSEQFWQQNTIKSFFIPIYILQSSFSFWFNVQSEFENKIWYKRISKDYCEKKQAIKMCRVFFPQEWQCKIFLLK